MTPRPPLTPLPPDGCRDKDDSLPSRLTRWAKFFVAGAAAVVALTMAVAYIMQTFFPGLGVKVGNIAPLFQMMLSLFTGGMGGMW